MSAQQIPNLLSLRGGRSRGGRGRGRGRPVGSEDNALASQNRRDLVIQSTDTDAAVSRLSAVDLGYLEDPYASYFVSGSGTRRQPLINRGTYTRTTALDKLIDAFISAGNGSESMKQIISLGAGTDTRYFRLRDQNKNQNLVYHEFDFPSVSMTKWRTVAMNEFLARGDYGTVLFPESMPAQPPVLEPDDEWGFMRSNDGNLETMYCFHPVDLRQLPNSNSPLRGLRHDLPTLIISECCLCYFEVEDSRSVVKWFTDKIPSLGIVLYEPIGVHDSFGQMMVANLAARNIVMPSLNSYKTLLDQKNRLTELGFTSENGMSSQEAETVENIWKLWISPTEKERVDYLEGLDEVEEWQMLARHYAVVWGWRGSGWEGWTKSLDPN